MLAGFLGQSAQAQGRASTIVPGEILVRWKSQRAPLVLSPGTSPARWQQSDLRSQLGAKLPGSRLKRVFAASGWSVVTLPAGQSTAAARAALVKSLGAANVSLNFRRHATRTPNDPSYGTQWQWPKIQAPDAWNSGVGSGDVVVAVLDSGVDLNHADIQANLWKNPREIAGNGIDDDGNGYIDDVYGLNGIAPSAPPQDKNGHGTHVAGLIGAVGNNGVGVTGANWNVKVMALQFLDAEGSGADDDAIACFEYAIKMKQSGVNLRVINNSYAGPDDNPAFKEAYQAAENAGILNVCAAGNEGANNDTTPQYPASYSTGTNISVAASDQNDALPYFSNYGAQSVDLAAPGVSIASLQLGGGIVEMSGTSMATPIVAGAAALVSSLEPGLSASALKARLMATVDKIAALQGAVASGGRLNLARAVAPITYEFKGQVYRLNGTTRVPLAGAKVAVSGKASLSALTDSNGRYSFKNIAPGTYSFAVTLKGYTFYTTSRTISSSGINIMTVDFRATSVPPTTYTLFGIARDTAGVAQKGISIALSTAPTTALTVTDSSGRYTLSGLARSTYSLKAFGGNFKWVPTPSSISVPESAVNGKAEVNFKGYLIDKDAPAISIATPAEGATFAPGNQLASGTARDATDNQAVYLQLTRFINFTPSYYDWVARVWVADRTAATIFTRALSGNSASWSLTLPSLAPANYSLRVWGRDTLGNVSKGEADAFSAFSVVKSTSSALSSAGSS